MKNSKKDRSINFFILLISALVMSCVSTGKYQSSLNELEQLRQENVQLESIVTDLQRSSTQQQTAQEQRLSKANRSLDSLTELLNRKESKLRLMQTRLMNAFPDMSNQQVETFVKDGYLHLSLDSRVLFNRGEHSLRPDGKTVIKGIIASLHGVSSDIMILGHTDNVPVVSPDYDNWRLSIDRAHAVSEIMIENGISPERMIIAGRSKHDPFLANETQVGRLLNRRIEMILMPDMKRVESIFEDFVN